MTLQHVTLTSTTPVGAPRAAGSPAPCVVPARPEPVAFAAAQSALIVVDMQNAYASVGGYVDQAGFSVAGAQAAADKILQAISAARAAGMLVVFLQNGWDADYVEAGGPGSPNWYKSNALKTMRKKPELAGRFLAKGGWDYALMDCMQPQPGDIVVPKVRYSGFFHSQLDSVLLEDATHALGGDSMQQATAYNVETFFGWVSQVPAFCDALQTEPVMA